MLSVELLAGIVRVARAVGAAPEDLLTTILLESGGRADARNPLSDASGLIQFMPSTLIAMGWGAGPSAFRALSPLEQLPYVERFLAHHKGKLGSMTRVYRAVFLPASLAVGDEPRAVVCAENGPHASAYAWNRALDADGDGAIRVEDLARKLGAVRVRHAEEHRRIAELGRPAVWAPDPAWALLSVRRRIVTVARSILDAGPVGDDLREADYRRFINCDLVPAGRIPGGPDVRDISPWRTSCAMFVRAVFHWAGRRAKLAINGQSIAAYLGVGWYEEDPAWVAATMGRNPFPGDVFYCASSRTANNGHVGVLLEEFEPGLWKTAEGGGDDGPGGAVDGTLCKYGQRSFRIRDAFDRYGRPLLGWWDVDEMSFPTATQLEEERQRIEEVKARHYRTPTIPIPREDDDDEPGEPSS